MAAAGCRDHLCYVARAKPMLVGDGSCLDANDLAAFLSGRLDAAATARLERHVARCRDCRELLSALARERSLASPPLVGSQPSDPGQTLGAEDAALPSGTQVGR